MSEIAMTLAQRLLRAQEVLTSLEELLGELDGPLDLDTLAERLNLEELFAHLDAWATIADLE